MTPGLMKIINITEELISQTFIEQIHNEYRLLPFNENNKFPLSLFTIYQNVDNKTIAFYQVIESTIKCDNYVRSMRKNMILYFVISFEYSSNVYNE